MDAVLCSTPTNQKIARKTLSEIETNLSCIVLNFFLAVASFVFLFTVAIREENNCSFSEQMCNRVATQIYKLHELWSGSWKCKHMQWQTKHNEQQNESVVFYDTWAKWAHSTLLDPVDQN